MKATLTIVIDTNIIPANEVEQDFEYLISQVDELGYIYTSSIDIEDK